MGQLVLLLMIFLLPATAWAGDAVSRFNGKADFSYGNMESEPGKNLAASITMPVGHTFGLQVDGLSTRVADVDLTGMGGHLFWRDWDRGLLGITAATLNGEYQAARQIGGEGEYYWGPVTLGLRAGWGTIEFDDPAPFIDTDVEKEYLLGDIGYYPLDNLLLSLTAGVLLDNTLIKGEIEYLTPIRGLSLFTEVVDGEHHYDHALFGIRYYFGAEKTLKRHHREDDPASAIAPVLQAVGTYGAEYNEKKRQYFPPGQAPPDQWGVWGADLVLPSVPFILQGPEDGVATPPLPGAE